MTNKPSYSQLEQKNHRLEEENKKLRDVEIELRKSEERFKALMEQNPISIEIYSPDGTQQDVNFAWQKLFGVKPEDTIGKYNCLQAPQWDSKMLLRVMLFPSRMLNLTRHNQAILKAEKDGSGQTFFQLKTIRVLFRM